MEPWETALTSAPDHREEVVGGVAQNAGPGAHAECSGDWPPETDLMRSDTAIGPHRGCHVAPRPTRPREPLSVATRAWLGLAQMGQYALTFEVPGEEVESINLYSHRTASE